MKYVAIDERIEGDIFTTEFQTAEQAIEEAKNMYYYMTAWEKKHSKIYVLESVNPDEEAEDHLDGNVIYTAKEDRNMKTTVIISGQDRNGNNVDPKTNCTEFSFSTLKDARRFISTNANHNAVQIDDDVYATPYNNDVRLVYTITREA